MRNDILIKMLLHLMSRRKATAAEMAARFDISARTVRRYAEVLSGAGVPVYGLGGRGGGIMIADNYFLDKMYFDGREYITILNILKNYNANTPAAEKLDTIIEKMNALAASRRVDDFVAGSEDFIIDGAPWMPDETLRAALVTMHDAIKSRSLCRLKYTDKDNNVSDREIEPHIIVLKEANWYVYAFCRLRGEFRVFRLSRVSNLVVRAERFNRRPVDTAAMPWNIEA